MYQISVRLKHAYASYRDLCKVCEEKKKKRIIFFESLTAYILGMAEGIFFKFLMWPSQVKGTSTVNLVPFGSGITELWMHKNCDFVVPVNVLTLFACGPFSWATQHTTVCLDTVVIVAG